MPTLPERLEAAVEKTEADSELLHQIVNGSDSTTVTTEGGPVNTAAKAIKELGSSANYATKGLSNVPAGSVGNSLLAADSVTLAKLASDVLAVIQGGLDPTKYQGLWTPATDTPTIPAAGGGNSGNWYFTSAAGTATGNAAGTYVYGDAIVSNGTVWLKRPAPPTVIPPDSVTQAMLDGALRQLLAGLSNSVKISKTFGSNQGDKPFVIAMGDKTVASLNSLGQLDFSMADSMLQTLVGQLSEYSPQIKKTFMQGRVLEIGVGGKVVFGVTVAGTVSPGGGSVEGGDDNAYGFPNHGQWGEWNLRDWRRLTLDRLLGTSLVIDVGCFGDSWSWNGNIWLEFVSRQLKAQLGDAGPGFISFSATVPGTSATIGTFADGADGSAVKTGTWSKPTNFEGRGPDLGEATSSTVGDKVTLTVNTVCSAVVLKYLKKSGGGLLRYRFNAGSWTTINTTNGSDAVGSDSLAGVPVSAPFTLEVEVESGSVTLFGAECQKTGPGVRFHKFGHSGARTDHWSAANALWESVVGTFSLKLAILGLGTNDQGISMAEDDFVDNESDVCDRLRTVRAGMDIMLFAPSENLAARPIPITRYRDATYRVATSKRCAFVDLARVFGDSTSDYDDSAPRVLFVASNTLHPTTDGNKQIASSFLKVLKP